MISAGEVGATFVILDEASPALRRIAEQMAALQGVVERTQVALKSLVMPPGLNRSLGVTKDRLAGIADTSKVTSDAVAASFVRIDTALAATSANVANLGRELKAIGAESRALGGGPSLRRGGGGGSHGGGVNFGGVGAPLPGGQHAHISGGPLLVGAAAVAYGAYEEARVQDFVNRIFLTGGISTGKETSNPLYGKIRDAIVKSYVMTGLPLEQIEEGILTGTRGLAGIPLEKRLALMPQLLAASATEAYLKEGTSIPEAMQAFVGLAHMEGKYSPEEIGKLADHFAYLSTTTPVTVKQIESAASYAIPMLRTADFDPEQILLMITSMERAGITNTKAGTWISNLATQSFPGTSLMSKMLFKKHEAALKALGLIDKNEKPTWFTDGKPDLVKMTGIAGEAISKMDPAHRLAIEKALWGQQGGRAAGFFADPTNRAIMAAVAAEEKDFISGEKMWKQSLENSPIVQFRTAFAGLNVELMNLGSNVLPYVTGALRAANETMGGKGELAAAGGGLLAFMFRKQIWRVGAGAVSRLFGAGAEALGSLGLGPAGGWGGLATLGSRASLAALPFAAIYEFIERTHKYASPKDSSYHYDTSDLMGAYSRQNGPYGFRAQPEANRGRALGALPPPTVNLTNQIKTDVKVLLDGAQLVAQIVSKVEAALVGAGFTMGHSQQDSHAFYSAPDVSGSGHQ